MTPSDGGQGAVPASPVTILAERLTSQQSLEQKEQHTWKMYVWFECHAGLSATAMLRLLSFSGVPQRRLTVKHGHSPGGTRVCSKARGHFAQFLSPLPRLM